LPQGQLGQNQKKPTGLFEVSVPSIPEAAPKTQFKFEKNTKLNEFNNLFEDKE
jgi:hypothetical protein